MRMDPVIMLAEELRSAEESLRAATRGNHGRAAKHLMLEIGYLEHQLCCTEPTSALGAGELIRLAAEQLQSADTRIAARLQRIAERFCAGRRELSDLIWLRALAPSLEKGAWGEPGRRAARFVGPATAGAAKPVLVYRTAACNLEHSREHSRAL